MPRIGFAEPVNGSTTPAIVANSKTSPLLELAAVDCTTNAPPTSSVITSASALLISPSSSADVGHARPWTHYAARQHKVRRPAAASRRARGPADILRAADKSQREGI